MKKILLLIIVLFLVGCTNISQENILKEEIQKEELHEEDIQKKEIPEKIFEDHSRTKIKNCEGKAIMFDYPPVDMNKVNFIEPMGSVQGEHVTPIDHQYYKAQDHILGNNAKIEIDVYSPGDGFITEIQHMGSFRGDNKDYPAYEDYRLIIKHTCTISSIFIHIDTLSKTIAKDAPSFGEYANVNIPVKAGEIIGTYTGSVDYNVVDKEIILSGFVLPESYDREEWKIHVKDPFDYFNEPIHTQLISKSLRTAKPEGGFIDYDIDGKLIGNWFKENTNKYAGIGQNRYWADHLSIIHNNIDPEHIIVSIGTYKGKAEQFGVKGNAPDPAKISVESGLVTYELTNYDYYEGNTHWNRESLIKGLKVRNENKVKGVALFELIEDRKLKVEIFPDKEASEVTGFTHAALIYER